MVDKKTRLTGLMICAPCQGQPMNESDATRSPALTNLFPCALQNHTFLQPPSLLLWRRYISEYKMSSLAVPAPLLAFFTHFTHTPKHIRSHHPPWSPL